MGGQGEEKNKKKNIENIAVPEQSSLCHYNNVCTLILFPDIFNTDGETIVEMCLCTYNKVVWALYESLLFPFFLPSHSEALVTSIAGKKRDKQLEPKQNTKEARLENGEALGENI